MSDHHIHLLTLHHAITHRHIHLLALHHAITHRPIHTSTCVRCAESLGYGELSHELWRDMPRAEGNRLDYAKMITGHLDIVGGKDQHVLGITNQDQYASSPHTRAPPQPATL